MRITRRRLRRLIRESVLTEEVIAGLGKWNTGLVMSGLILIPAHHRPIIIDFLVNDLRLTDALFDELKNADVYAELRKEAREVVEEYRASGDEDTGGDGELSDDALDIMMNELRFLLQKHDL